MANPTVVKFAKTNTDALTETGNASIAAVALTDSGNASRAAVQELTKAYQELASKNVKNLTAAMQGLAAVKSPAEFIELQRRLTGGYLDRTATHQRMVRTSRCALPRGH
jgi:hypothetical protein